MRPLVYYCRWQGATLRLRGRDETAVWGQLVFTNADSTELTQNFRFQLETKQLTLLQSDHEQVVQLDEMGTILTTFTP